MTSRVDLILRARRFIQAAGQVPRTGDLSANPGEAAWQLLEQVLGIAEAAEQPEGGDH